MDTLVFVLLVSMVITAKATSMNAIPILVSMVQHVKIKSILFFVIVNQVGEVCYAILVKSIIVWKTHARTEVLV